MVLLPLAVHYTLHVSAGISQYMHCSAVVSFARDFPDLASSWLMQPCRFVAVKIILTATRSDDKLASPACVAVHASQCTDMLHVVGTTLSALCSQVDDADTVTLDKQAVKGAVRRRVKVNRARGRAVASRAGEDLAGPVATMRGRTMGQGRAVAVTMEGREPRSGSSTYAQHQELWLVSISIAWHMDFGIGKSFVFIA